MIYFLLFFSFQKLINIDEINDFNFPGQFVIKNKGRNNYIEGEDLNVHPLWKEGTSGEKTYIRAIGTGLRISHADISDNLYIKDNFNFDKKNGEVFTSTQKSLIGNAVLAIAAAPINGRGIVGVSPDSKISYTSITANKTYSSEQIYEMIMKNNNATDVFIFPFQIIPTRKYQYSSDIDLAFMELAANEGNNGTIIINSAGNNGFYGADSNMYFHTCSRGVITVGSSTVRGAPAYYTNTGACISVVSPSSGLPDDLSEPTRDYPKVQIPSVDDDELVDTVVGKTEYSAGAVAGVAALIRSKHPEISALDIQTILEATATKIDPENSLWITNAAGYNYHPQLGFGRVNAKAAMEAADKWISPDEVTQEVTYDNFPGPVTGAVLSVSGGPEFITYTNLIFKINGSDLDGVSIKVTSPKGTNLTVLRPTAYNFTSRDESENNIRINEIDEQLCIGIRGFFGESSNGEWTVDFNFPDGIPERPLLSLTVEFYGYSKTFKMPEFTKQTASDSRIDYDPSLAVRSKITLPKNPDCGRSTITFGNTIPGNYQGIPIPIYAVDTKDGHPHQSFAIGDVIWKSNSTGEVILPCTFHKSLYLNLSLRIAPFELDVTAGIHIFNKGNESILTDPSTLKEGVNHITWRRFMERFPPPGIAQKALLMVYDMDARKVLSGNFVIDNGFADVVLPNVTGKKISISLIPFSNESAALTRIGTVPTPTPTGKPTPTDSNSNNRSIIFLGVTGGCVGIFVIVIGIIFIRKAMKRKAYEESTNMPILQT